MVSKDTILASERSVGQNESPLQRIRRAYQPRLPALLKDLSHVVLQREPLELPASPLRSTIQTLFPATWNQPLCRIGEGASLPRPLPRRVGVLFSGGQAPGGHNVIAGLYDAIKQRNGASRVFGFLNGSSGLMADLRYLELKDSLIDPYRNQGGFDLLGSGRGKIETPEQLEAVKKMMWALELHALVVIGGDDSNTNAAHLAEYFLQEKVPCQVIGIPKTIDGDLRNRYVELPFGFDTACKTYSEIIGNIARDALSAKKYTHFIKLMGRSASHVALECALQTHPNFTLISEEVKSRQLTLQGIVQELSDLICRRSLAGKDYGVILIPEGLLEFTSDGQMLIKELQGLGGKKQSIEKIREALTAPAAACFAALPPSIQTQLLLDRDPHGNVQVSKIETERLLIEMVEKELEGRQASGQFKGRFSAQAHFLGYEGRSGFPSNFDSDYCYTLGYTAAVLIENGVTGYVAFVQGLSEEIDSWRPGGCPLPVLMHLEERGGEKKLVIQKALVDLSGASFQTFAKEREHWTVEDHYCYPGPLQFFGPDEICHAIPLTLAQLREYNNANAAAESANHVNHDS